MTILCDHTGLTAFWSEEIDLLQLGKARMQRATVVEFAEDKQVWEVRSPDLSTLLFEHSSRNACLAWEHANQETITHSTLTQTK